MEMKMKCQKTILILQVAVLGLTGCQNASHEEYSISQFIKTTSIRGAVSLRMNRKYSFPVMKRGFLTLTLSRSMEVRQQHLQHPPGIPFLPPHFSPMTGEFSTVAIRVGMRFGISISGMKMDPQKI